MISMKSEDQLLATSKIRVLMLGESLDKQGGIVSVEKLILKYVPGEVKISHLATLQDGSKIHKILVFINALNLLCCRLTDRSTDLVHIHVSERGSAFRQALTTTVAWLLHKPVILHTHSAEFQVFYSKLSPIIKAGLNWAFCRSTRFIVLSYSWKKFYIDNLGLKEEQVVVLPNPVKFPVEIPQRINSKKVRLLFLGKIGDRKGTFDLINAITDIPLSHRQNLELTIAGDGEGQRARVLIESLNLAQHIKILDWVNEQQRDDLLKQSDVFILPSYNEGLPMAILEAMSWGLPIITTPVGGIPELVIPHHNGLLVEPGEIKQLSQAIQSLIQNEELRLSLGKAARETVSPFEISKYCDRLTDIFRECLDTNVKK
jgi:glycosyltransferase involved in cell wall biosynthesis